MPETKRWDLRRDRSDRLPAAVVARDIELVDVVPACNGPVGTAARAAHEVDVLIAPPVILLLRVDLDTAARCFELFVRKLLDTVRIERLAVDEQPILALGDLRHEGLFFSSAFSSTPVHCRFGGRAPFLITKW